MLKTNPRAWRAESLEALGYSVRPRCLHTWIRACLTKLSVANFFLCLPTTRPARLKQDITILMSPEPRSTEQHIHTPDIAADGSYSYTYQPGPIRPHPVPAPPPPCSCVHTSHPKFSPEVSALHTPRLSKLIAITGPRDARVMVHSLVLNTYCFKSPAARFSCPSPAPPDVSASQRSATSAYI